ncbi:MAG: hypothetical protein CMG75_01795 [Candidatus Marinimicrobia bacterium]|nr:hypothetical protein [Candidatus Neomarinimicrobiota bacterium]
MNKNNTYESAWNDEDAEWYSKNCGEHLSTILSVQLANLKPSDVVLDIGCGSGNSCRKAAEFTVTGKVIGIDPTPGMIRIAKRLSKKEILQNRINYFYGYAEDIPFSNKSVDVVLAINSIFHWGNIKKGILETFRVLKSNKFFFIADQLKNDNTMNAKGKLAYAENMILLLKNLGFNKSSYKIYNIKNDQMIFFSSKKVD